MQCSRHFGQQRTWGRAQRRSHRRCMARFALLFERMAFVGPNLRDLLARVNEERIAKRMPGSGVEIAAPGRGGGLRLRVEIPVNGKLRTLRTGVSNSFIITRSFTQTFSFPD